MNPFPFTLTRLVSKAPIPLIDQPLAPKSLNEEEKDFIKAATRGERLYPHRKLDSLYHLLEQAFDEAPEADLGLLNCFSNEIVAAIVSELDLTSCMRLRQVNRTARLVVTGVPKYQLVVKNAFDFLGKVLTSGLGPWYTLNDIVPFLYQEHCEFCDDFATIVCLPNWKKTCERCGRNDKVPRDLISRDRAQRILKLSAKRLQKLVPVMNLQLSEYRPYRTRHLLTVTSLRELCNKIELSRPIDLIRAELVVIRDRDLHPLCCDVPFIDGIFGETHYGMCCRSETALPFLLRGHPCSEKNHHVFGAAEFHAHVTSCHSARTLKQLLDMSADASEVEDGWVWIEGPLEGFLDELDHLARALQEH